MIDGSHAVRAQLEAADWLYHQICTALDCRPAAEQPKREWPLLPMEPLSQVRLDQALGEKEYRKQLKKCRKELAELHNELYRKKVPVVIVYEGWDAAGKGGNIPPPWTPGAMRSSPSPPPPTTSWPGITCGGSGSACQRRATSPSLTAAGTGG